MPRYKDEPLAVGVYSVCDESRYLIVRNVPSLGCGDDLLKLFASYGEVEECKAMDEEDCDQFTDVYWIQFSLVTKLRVSSINKEGFVNENYKFPIFIGINGSSSRTIEPYLLLYSDATNRFKLIISPRNMTYLFVISAGRSKGSTLDKSGASTDPSLRAIRTQTDCFPQHVNSSRWYWISSDQVCKLDYTGLYVLVFLFLAIFLLL